MAASGEDGWDATTVCVLYESRRVDYMVSKPLPVQAQNSINSVIQQLAPASNHYFERKHGDNLDPFHARELNFHVHWLKALSSPKRWKCSGICDMLWSCYAVLYPLKAIRDLNIMMRRTSFI